VNARASVDAEDGRAYHKVIVEQLVESLITLDVDLCVRVYVCEHESQT
jgi:hypothetical protein